MANWCVNKVEIISIENKDVYKEFNDWLIKESEQENGCEAQLPTGIDSIDGYLFDIEFYIDDPYFIFFSKWAPSIKTMVVIGKKYNFSFILEFEELGMGLYGQYVWDNDSNKLKIRYLSDEELASVDDDTDSTYDEYNRLLDKKDLKLSKYNEI